MDIAQLDEMLHGAGNVGHHAQLLYLIELAAVELKAQDLEKWIDENATQECYAVQNHHSPDFKGLLFYIT